MGFDLDLYSQQTGGDPFGGGADPFGPGMIDPTSFAQAMGGAGTMDDSAALAQALQAFQSGSHMQLPQLQPVTPQDPFEAMAMAGGAPQAPPVTPVLGGGTPISSLAQALLHGADAFLGVPVAQAGARVASRQAQNDMARQAAIVAARNDSAFSRQAALAILRAHFLHRGEPQIAHNIEAILAAGAKYGRGAAPILASALGADTTELQPILDSLPEQGSVQQAAGTTPLTIDGRTVKVPNRALPGTLMGLQAQTELARNRGVQADQNTVSAIDQILDKSRQQVKDELGLGSFNISAKDDAAARAQYPGKLLEKATNIVRQYEKARLLPPGSTDVVRGMVAGEQAPPPAGGGNTPPAPALSATDDQIKGQLAGIGTRADALQWLANNGSRFDDDTQRRFKIALERKYGPVGRGRR